MRIEIDLETLIESDLTADEYILIQLMYSRNTEELQQLFSSREALWESLYKKGFLEKDSSLGYSLSDRSLDMLSSDVRWFDEFWKAWPGPKENKEKCRIFYKRFVTKISLHKQILDAIESQRKKREARERAGKFSPSWAYPYTWLNGKRWEDEVTEEEVSVKTANVSGRTIL